MQISWQEPLTGAPAHAPPSPCTPAGTASACKPGPEPTWRGMDQPCSRTGGPCLRFVQASRVYPFLP